MIYNLTLSLLALHCIVLHFQDKNNGIMGTGMRNAPSIRCTVGKVNKVNKVIVSDSEWPLHLLIFSSSSFKP